VGWSGRAARWLIRLRVSIVIPALDEAATISEVVARLRTWAAWREVIVVDDGSRDATASAAHAAGARVVRHPYNKGNGAAVKTGIRHASGEFVLIPMATDSTPRRMRNASWHAWANTISS
jgi:glycosyltransferase involved in cell wall biosynthesis